MFKLNEPITRPMTEEERRYYDSGQWSDNTGLEAWTDEKADRKEMA